MFANTFPDSLRWKPEIPDAIKANTIPILYQSENIIAVYKGEILLLVRVQ